MKLFQIFLLVWNIVWVDEIVLIDQLYFFIVLFFCCFRIVGVLSVWSFLLPFKFFLLFQKHRNSQISGKPFQGIMTISHSKITFILRYENLLNTSMCVTVNWLHKTKWLHVFQWSELISIWQILQILWNSKRRQSREVE